MGADSWAHKQRRKALLPSAYGKPCPFCDKPMTRDDDLDLDHSLPVALGGGDAGDRFSHASCNRRSGAVLGNRLRAGTHNSRDW